MPTHPLPPPFATSPDPLTLVSQGAEALLYKTVLLTPSTPCALKVRPAKPWRHPSLDRRLTRQRVLAEARALLRCARARVPVPAVLALDWEAGWLALEWVPGRSVKEALRRRAPRVGGGLGGGDGHGQEGGEDGEEGGEDGEEVAVRRLMRGIGRAVARLHDVGVVHGDLTTSNMMLRPAGEDNGGGGGGEDEEGGDESWLDGEVVLIDFGLAVQTVQEEDRAVDLYVLERAFGSTHPREEAMFGDVLEGYKETFKGARGTLKRLEDVRLRGRKKSMLG